jgi:hypothetical protein
VAEVAVVDPRSLPRDAVLPAVVEANRVMAMMAGVLAGLAARVDVDEIHADDQYLSATTCIATETNSSLPATRRVVKQAARLRELPATTEGLRAGVITVDHAECLIRALNPRTRDAMTIDEASFVVAAQHMTFREFARKVDAWLLFHDSDGANDPVHETSKLTPKPGVFGRGMLVGDFAPADYREIRAMIDAEGNRLFHRDAAERDAALGGEVPPMRTTSERQAEAPMNIIVRARNSNDDSIGASPLASIAIVVTPDELDAQTGAHGLEDGAAIEQDDFERFCCDADFYRAVITADSEAIDLGRTVRTATPGQKRLLAAATVVASFPVATGRRVGARNTTWSGGSTTARATSTTSPSSAARITNRSTPASGSSRWRPIKRSRLRNLTAPNCENAVPRRPRPSATPSIECANNKRPGIPTPTICAVSPPCAPDSWPR